MMASTDELILFIGKGPSVTKTDDYEEAEYFFSNRPSETIRTPFVAEALVSLADKDFDRIHVLGTSGAMWNVILKHAGHEFDEETIEHLLFLERDRPDELPDFLRERIEEAVGRYLGVAVEPHLIPLGTSTEEYWEILHRLSQLDLGSGRVSIDITHSLRSHPVFLLLALAYFRSIEEDLSLGSVYYGAFALDNHFEGRAPIFDLRPMVELLDWIDAAQAFDRYGDATPLAALLRESEAELEDLAKRAEYVSRVLQLNTLSKVQANTRKLTGLLEDLPDDSPLPLRLIRPRLNRLPERLQGRPEWEATLVTAREHWSSYRAGPAVLTTWEAVLERLADLFGVSAEEYEMQRRLKCLATDYPHVWSRAPERLSSFSNRAATLREYRNAIAHSRQGDEEDIQPNHVYERFPDLLEYFEDVLRDDALERLPDAVSLSRYADDD